MIIKELFSKTYNLVKYNLVLVQPLLVFFLLLGFILRPASVAGAFNIASIIMLISVFGMFCAFWAGWFHMFHKSIETSVKEGFTSEERAVHSLNLFKEFFPGVGKFFPKMVIGLIIYVILFLLVINLTGIIGEKFIGYPQALTNHGLSMVFMNEEQALKVLNSMSNGDKIKIAEWNILTLVLTGIFSYLSMFWVQAIIAGNKNPVTAYIESVKTVVKRPFITISIYLAYWVSITGVIILSAASSMNFILQFIGLMILILIVVYFTMMSFLYFEKYRENNSISWTDSFR